MTDEIMPALTPAEWASRSIERQYEPNIDWDERSVSIACGDEYDVHIDDTHRHRLAAACLAGQPFGFTIEDVALLAEARYVLDMGYGDADDMDRCDSLAARIAALLPPETP